MRKNEMASMRRRAISRSVIGAGMPASAGSVSSVTAARATRMSQAMRRYMGWRQSTIKSVPSGGVFSSGRRWSHALDSAVPKEETGAKQAKGTFDAKLGMGDGDRVGA